MRWNTILAVVFFMAGCGVAEQPESATTVAAYEVPLTDADDRRDFLAIMSQVAVAQGFHVDSATAEELTATSELFKLTINASVWQGKDDDESLAHVMDAPDHPAWLTFSKGENPDQSLLLRQRLMTRIYARWPGTLKLPIMPTGSIPHVRDLVRTPDGYTVSPETLAKFEAEEKAHPD